MTEVAGGAELRRPEVSEATTESWAAWGRSAPLIPTGFAANIEPMLRAQSPAILRTASIALVGIVALIDFATGADLNFSIFYMVPLIFTTWFLSRREGFAAAILSVGLWVYFDMIAGAHYTTWFIPMWNAAVRLGFFLFVIELVHLMKMSRAREAMLARTDSLTGAANGRSFADRANLELARLRRSGRPVTLAYLDLDHFKVINDTLGHTEGDRLLQAVATAVRSRLRSVDMFARLGGDEFAILLPDTGRDAAPKALDDVMASVTAAVDGQWHIGCTIGAMTFERAPESVDLMVRLSDHLMYSGKQRGRRRIEYAVWPPSADQVEESFVSAR